MKNEPVAYRVEYLCGGCNKAHAWGECTEKQLKNEPVAWIDKNTGKPKMEGFIKTEYDIPLYTHPADLTDEEINDFTVKIYNCRTGAEAHEIVLAILKKAQEK